MLYPAGPARNTPSPSALRSRESTVCSADLGGWQLVPPGGFDERAGRDRPARAHKQSGQHRAPPPARQRDRHTVPADLQGAKHGEGRYHLIHLTDCG
jgi:hypothetical protein